MSTLDRRIGQARFRLSINQLAQHLSWGIAVAAGLWSLAWLVERLYAVGVPFGASAAAAAGLALLSAVIASSIRRVDSLTAALALDSAAGLKERVSTGLVCRNDGDEFARAALRDAEKTAGGVSVRAHIKYRVPAPWPWAAGALFVAVCLGALMPQVRLFAKHETQVSKEDQARVEQERKVVTAALNEQVDKIKKLGETNSAVKELAKDLEPLELPKNANLTPEDIKREAVKQIEKLADKLAQQKNADQEDVAKQLKNMLAKLDPQSDVGEENKLASALATGDFAGAKQALDDMKKKLEEAAKSGDEEAQKKLAEMQKKLDSVAKQLAEAANSQKLQKELENKAGMSSEEAKELLQQLSKMDAKQLQKELQKRLGEKGLSKEQIEKLGQKVANNQQAMKMAQKMAQSMAKASKCMGQCQKEGKEGKEGQKGQQGQQGQNPAAEGEAALAEAEEQLDEMEISEQQINELEARLAELDDLKDSVGGCDSEMDPGDQVGEQGPQYGLGQGSRIGKERLAHKMKSERANTKLRGGKIIGQVLVSGEQIKGDAKAEVQEAMNAAVRDATDAINRDEVPRQYERALRTYFDRLAGLAGNKEPAGGEKQKPAGREKGSESEQSGDKGKSGGADEE